MPTNIPTKRGVNYVPTSSKRGRQIMAQTSRQDTVGYLRDKFTAEQAAWNAEVERKKAGGK
jgi:hypothetical protein